MSTTNTYKFINEKFEHHFVQMIKVNNEFWFKAKNILEVVNHNKNWKIINNFNSTDKISCAELLR